MSTPKKNDSTAPFYNFYDYLTDKEDPSKMKYYCKSCGAAQSAPTTSNLIKHLTKTKLDKHRNSIEEFKKLIAISPVSSGRNNKRPRIDEASQACSPMSNLYNDLVKMGAVTPKQKFKFNNPRQIEW